MSESILESHGAMETRRHPTPEESMHTSDTLFPGDSSEEHKRYPEDAGFSKEQMEILLKEGKFKCATCGAALKDVNKNTGKVLEPHLVKPVSKGGEVEANNGVILCKDCHDVVHKVASAPPIEKTRLTKARKRKLWKMKGRGCEDCGTKFVTGGPHQAIHPFHTADWNGQLDDLKVLCTGCVGIEASKRDKILRLVSHMRDKIPPL